MLMLTLLVLCAPLATESAAPLSLSDLLARARPSPELPAAEAAIAAAERRLAESSPHLREGWSLGFTAGPRWTDETTRGDLAIEAELPLWRGDHPRAAVRATLAEAARVWREEARAESEGRITTAYLAAYGAEQRLALRREEVATLERLLTVARRRVEAGAEAPYEGTLVEAELASAGLALAQAAGDRARAWAELAVWVEIPTEPVRLAAPDASQSRAVDDPRSRFAASALARGPVLRAELTTALALMQAARDEARWSLQGELAIEAEERVARAGASYRVPLRGEKPAIQREAETTAGAARREAETAVAALAARLQGALRQREALAGAPSPVRTEVALAALELRLAEGKAQPSEVLLLRRQLLQARACALELELARAAVEAELAVLTRSAQPQEAQP